LKSDNGPDLKRIEELLRSMGDNGKDLLKLHIDGGN